MPLILETDSYKFKTGSALYGIYQNKEYIRQAKKCVLFEGEKSVMKAATMYKRNPSAAVFGSSVSEQQIRILQSLDVEEVILAFDYDATGREEEKFTKLKTKIESCGLRCTFMFDGYEENLQAHDAPIDRGKEIFELLLKKRR